MQLTPQEKKFLADLYEWALRVGVTVTLYAGMDLSTPYFEADVLHHDVVWKHNIFGAPSLRELKLQMAPIMKRMEDRGRVELEDSDFL